MDYGYGSGFATLSQLAAEGINTTFCNSCYLGICSAGAGSGAGSSWNNYILDHIMRSTRQDALTEAHPDIKKWSYGQNHVRSPYVLNQGNRRKQYAVKAMLQWYNTALGINIPTSSVYFFGDRSENIPPFKDFGLNSREVSCNSRDHYLYGGSGIVGYCGATPEEVVQEQGNFNCQSTSRATAATQELVLP